MNWRNDAKCRDEDPELFFPVGNMDMKGSPAWNQAQEAKAVCARCPVVSNCLEDALKQGKDDGVFGGMTPKERRDAKRRARI